MNARERFEQFLREVKDELRWFFCIDKKWEHPTCWGIVLLMALLFYVGCFALCRKAHASEVWTAELIMEAIYRAEGGIKARYAYGIRSIPYTTISEARQICLNSVKNNMKRWYKAGCPGSFVDFMSRRYCPVNCDNDRGTNKYWADNVRYFARKLQRGE